MKKISYCFLLLLFFVACNPTKHVIEGQFMLEENNIIIDSTKVQGADLQKYILQKPNGRVFGIPIGLHLHNIGNHNKPKTPSEWALENPNSYNFVKKIFSKKQSIAYANSFINLNNWWLNFPEPIILNTKKVENTKSQLETVFKNQGYYEPEIISEIKRDSLKKTAEVFYRINRGKPYFLDTVSIKINSPVLDSIYKAEKPKSLIKKGVQFNDQLFRTEAKNVVKLFRNSGVFHFTESAMGFYIDTLRIKTEYKANVDFIISENRLTEDQDNQGNYIETPYQVHKIKKVNVYTDYSFEKKGEPFNDTITYNNITFLAHDKLRYNPKFLSQSIFLKPEMVYKDTLTNLTRIHLKSLKNFKTTSINFSKHQGNNGELAMDVFLAPI